MNDDKNKFILYTTLSGEVRVDVLPEDETVWLTQKAMAELFGVVKSTVSEHLSNIFNTNQLEELSTVGKFRTVQEEG